MYNYSDKERLMGGYTESRYNRYTGKYYDEEDDDREHRRRDSYDGDYTRINEHGYDSASCPRCGSTDIDSKGRYCHSCGNIW